MNQRLALHSIKSLRRTAYSYIFFYVNILALQGFQLLEFGNLGTAWLSIA
jgi:hypothetical protein